MKLYSALISLSLIWGLSFAFIKILVDSGTGPWGVVFLRCLAGAVILFFIMLTQKNKRQQLKNAPWLKLITIGLFNAGLPWALIALSEQKIYSSTASILNATTPIWTSVLGFLIFGIILKFRQWLGILLGFVGILVLLNFDVAKLFSDNFVGIGTMIIAAIFYGFSSQFSKRYLQGVSVTLTALSTLIVGSITGLVGMISTTGFFSPHLLMNDNVMLSVVGLGMFGSGIAYLLFFYLIKEGSAEFATYVTYLVPVTAMIWGKVIFNESISSNLYFGLIFIIIGVYLSTRVKRVKENSNVIKTDVV